MKHAYFFSRNPVACINLANTTESWLKIEQRRDRDLSVIIKKLEFGEDVEHFHLKDSVLMRRYVEDEPGCKILKKVVPSSYQWSLINAYHTALKHFGWEKTLSKLREEYWFPDMSSTVRQFVENCIICKTSKGMSGNKQLRLHPIEKKAIPFHTVHIDITGKLTKRYGKYEYVVVVIDAFTKFALLSYATDKTSASLLGALKRVVSLFGAPEQIISDQDPAFKAEFEEYCKHLNIHQHYIAAGISRANGQVERIMSIVKNGLTLIRNYENNDWRKSLENLQLAINSTKNKTTNVSPIKALTGRHGAVPPELICLVNDEENITKQEKIHEYM
ncbi:MAG: transposase family protein, partial [Providencia heimbachae]|nr:transposase family protein [Providencia heimbachae]